MESDSAPLRWSFTFVLHLEWFLLLDFGRLSFLALFFIPRFWQSFAD